MATNAAVREDDGGDLGAAGGRRRGVTVSDDGPGIAPDDRSRIFERFSALDDSRASAAAAPAWSVDRAGDRDAYHGTIRADGVDDNLKHGIGSGSANGSTSDAKCGYLRSPRTKPIPPPSGSPGRGTFALPGRCFNPA
ncbi:MAG TPA: hypothetical protein VI030_11005 [Propionibacteriaceae bacterium]